MESIYSMIEFEALRVANVRRQIEWDPTSQVTPLFRTLELGGEVGEVLNVVKKLERERLGMRGSRDTLEHLAEELGDVVICADLVASMYGIDLWKATRDKFNATSDKVGLQTHIE
jgi:NTP pyrophosphatase (non-canonical NTP hydrolase)